LAALAENQAEDLPDVVGLSQVEIDRYYPLWLLWRATEKKFLPSQLMIEPGEPLSVMLELDSYFDRIARQKMDDENKDAE
jgi:hypothetical protein